MSGSRTGVGRTGRRRGGARAGGCAQSKGFREQTWDPSIKSKAKPNYRKPAAQDPSPAAPSIACSQVAGGAIAMQHALRPLQLIHHLLPAVVGLEGDPGGLQVPLQGTGHANHLLCQGIALADDPLIVPAGATAQVPAVIGM